MDQKLQSRAGLVCLANVPMPLYWVLLLRTIELSKATAHLNPQPPARGVGATVTTINAQRNPG